MALLLIWKEIVNNLSINSIFKLQLKLELGFTSKDIEEDKIFIKLENDKITQIRSIGSVRSYTKKILKMF